MRDHEGRLTFAPRLPSRLRRLAFRLMYLGRRLTVEVTGEGAVYALLEGKALEIRHHGERAVVPEGKPLRLPIPPAPSRPEPSQPPGRAPMRRRPDAHAEEPAAAATALRG
jgi:alpha,alpha-trehalose phosphorylase